MKRISEQFEDPPRNPCPVSRAREEHAAHEWRGLKAGGPWLCPGYPQPVEAEDSANTIKAGDIITGPTLDLSAGNVSSADYNKALTAHVVPGFQPLHEIEFYIARFNAQPWTGPFSSYDEAWRWVSSRAWSTYTISKLIKP